MRHALLRALSCGLLAVFGGRAAAAGPAPKLSVTFFNIRYFGMDGEVDGTLGHDARVPTLKAHLAAHKLLADVMVFEEIVDVAMLTEQVLENRYDCRSYEVSDPRHQHVVLCARAAAFRLVRDAGAKGFTFDDIALNGRVRPAVHATVASKAGAPLLHLVGLHLKAMENMGAMRLEQMKLLAADLRARPDDGVPTLIVGDMNTFGDDPAAFQTAFDAAGLPLHEVENPAAYTWRGTLSTRSKLDRAWLTDGVAATAPAVAGPCNDQTATREALKAYYDEVSDHCAVSFALTP